MDAIFPTLAAYLKDELGALIEEHTAKILAGPEGGMCSTNQAKAVAAAIIWDNWVGEWQELQEVGSDEAEAKLWEIEEKCEIATPQAVLIDLSGNRSLLLDTDDYNRGKLRFAPNYIGYR
jgi:hypothetical protein